MAAEAGGRAVAVPRVPVDEFDDGWADDDFGTEEEGAPAGLSSGPLLGAAVRRGVWLWCLMGVAGLLAGVAFTVLVPPTPQGSATVLVAHSPDENPADAILTDVALAQSRTVAVDAMRALGLPRTPQGVTRFQASYTATQVTDRLILFMAKAPATGQAVARVKVVADEFLRLRAHQLQSGQQDTVAAINRQITRAKKQIAAASKKIAAIAPESASSALAAPPGQATVAAGSLSRADKARLTALQTKRSQQEAALSGLEQAVQAYQVSNQVAVAGEVAGSRVLDAAAPVHRSLVRHALLYAAAGLAVGLLLGLALVIVRALVSGRLLWRDDIARALGAPVHLSVGPLRAARWRPGRRGPDRDVQRLVAHLRSAVPARAGGAPAPAVVAVDNARQVAPALAVVAVDNARQVAPSLVALAVSYAQEGRQVVLADLAGGAPAARLLGISRPATGTVRVNAVRVHGVSLVVTVPARDSAALAGPLPHGWPGQPGVPGMPGPPGPPSEAVAAVYASADLLLSLVTLDPAAGADHLPTWADSAVAAVTAGQSSGTRIHAVGEMIRLAGTPLVSTVLIGADKYDESLGATTYTPTPATSRAGQASQALPRPDSTQRPSTTESPNGRPDAATYTPAPDTGRDSQAPQSPDGRPDAATHTPAPDTGRDRQAPQSPDGRPDAATHTPAPDTSRDSQAPQSPDGRPDAATHTPAPDTSRDSQAVASPDGDTENLEAVPGSGADASGSRAPELGRSRAVVRRLPRQGVRRLSWGVADQAVSSLTNFAVTIYVARALGAEQFGAFSLAYVTYAFALNASRGLATDPLMVRFSGTDLPTWRRAVASCTGTAAAVGLLAGAFVLVASAFLSGTTRAAFFALGLTLPGLLLQDSWRYSFFALGRGRGAFLNDLAWASALVPALLFLRLTGHADVFWYVFAWGAAAAVGAAVGPVQARVIPRLSQARGWISRHRDLGPRYLAENTANSGAAQLRLYGVAIIIGVAAAGYVQAANTLMGPFLVVFMGFSLVTIPEAGRVLRRSPRHLRPFCLLIGGGLAIIGLAWGFVLLLALPRGLGAWLLGPIWQPAYPLILPLTISVAGACLAAGATSGLHALGAARRSLRAMVVSSAAYLAFGLLGAWVGGVVGTVRGIAVATWVGALVWWWQLHAGLRESGHVPAGSRFWPRRLGGRRGIPEPAPAPPEPAPAPPEPAPAPPEPAPAPPEPAPAPPEPAPAPPEPAPAPPETSPRATRTSPRATRTSRGGPARREAVGGTAVTPRAARGCYPWMSWRRGGGGGARRVRGRVGQTCPAARTAAPAQMTRVRHPPPGGLE